MSEWISVKDKMPKVEDRVLIRAQRRCGNAIESIITTAFYEDGTVLDNNSCWHWEEIWEWGEYDEEKNGYRIPKGWWEGRQYGDMIDNDINDEVTHWMPLPELPEEDNGNNG